MLQRISSIIRVVWEPNVMKLSKNHLCSRKLKRADVLKYDTKSFRARDETLLEEGVVRTEMWRRGEGQNRLMQHPYRMEQNFWNGHKRQSRSRGKPGFQLKRCLWNWTIPERKRELDRNQIKYFFLPHSMFDSDYPRKIQSNAATK